MSFCSSMSYGFFISSLIVLTSSIILLFEKEFKILWATNILLCIPPLWMKPLQILGVTLFSLFVKTFDIILYDTLHKLIGL